MRKLWNALAIIFISCLEILFFSSVLKAEETNEMLNNESINSGPAKRVLVAQNKQLTKEQVMEILLKQGIKIEQPKNLSSDSKGQKESKAAQGYGGDTKNLYKNNRNQKGVPPGLLKQIAPSDISKTDQKIDDAKEKKGIGRSGRSTDPKKGRGRHRP